MEFTISLGFAVTVIGIALSAMAYGNPTGAGILGRYSGDNKLGINPMKILGPMIIFVGLCLGVGGIGWVKFTINKHKVNAMTRQTILRNNIN
jgi:hypothetical protein